MIINMLRGHLNEIDLNKYYYQERVITDPQEILTEIEKIVRERHNISQELFNARVFINNATRDDFGYRISNSPPYKDESLHQWLQRITEASSFCTVINGINGWSDSLAEIVIKKFNEEWVSAYGVPSQGIDVYIFMGKYNITPFGIHKDQEHTFLYHLGPGIKKAWIWDPSLTDIEPFIQSDTFNLTDTLSLAHALTLHPGDALFIPQNWYHVLENPEFSVTLGVAPYEQQQSELLVAFLKEALADSEQDDAFVFLDHSHCEFHHENALMIVPSLMQKMNLLHIAEKGMVQLFNVLKSNHYFKYTSPLRNVHGGNYRYFGKVVIGEEDDSATRVYCRGRSFTVRNKFRGAVIQLQKLIASPDFHFICDDSDPQDTLHFLLNKMISMGVLV